MALGKTFFIQEFDNGNKLVLSGDYSGIVEGSFYIAKTMPTYEMEIGSTIMFSGTACQVSFTDSIDHNVDLILIAKRQADTLEKVQDMEDVDEIKEWAVELGLDLDDRKKRLSSVIEDFINVYKDDQGI